MTTDVATGLSRATARLTASRCPAASCTTPTADGSSTASVRVQWDPERALGGQPQPYRSLQVGLSGSAVTRYVTEWIRSIEDITSTLERRRHGLDHLPVERPYPLPVTVVERILASA